MKHGVRGDGDENARCDIQDVISGCSERECWVRENPVFINLLEHLFFFRQQNRE
jgi:hypothetical protein